MMDIVKIDYFNRKIQESMSYRAFALFARAVILFCFSYISINFLDKSVMVSLFHGGTYHGTVDYYQTSS
jgi:hypothetical protein